MSNPLRETDKAYLAGLIDGEGCISIAKQKITRSPTPVYYLMVSIVSTDKNLLDYWRDITGLGNLCITRKGNLKERDCYQWQLTSNQAIELLILVYQYLILKKDQADIAFNFKKTFLKKGGWYGKTTHGVKGGERVPIEIIDQRERCKQELSTAKGYKVIRGRPLKLEVEI